MLLGIDASGAVSVAVADRSGLRCERTVTDTKRHAEVLTPLIESLLSEAGISRSDVTGIVAGRGPGPFTGLRVGLVSARTLALALDVPVLGVCSLDALALAAAESMPTSQHSPALRVASVLDARRKEVYFNICDVDSDSRMATGTRITTVLEPEVMAPAQAAEAFAAQRADVVVGRGAWLYQDQLRPSLPEVLDARAGKLVEVALLRQAAGDSLKSTEPLYLRKADAAVPTTRKRALPMDRAVRDRS